jgi:hypothetical protein
MFAKPTTLQRVFASRWVGRAWFATACGTCVYLVMREVLVRSADLWVLFYSVVLLPIALGLGFFGGVLSAAVIWPPLVTWRERINGGPFSEGDVVEVLRGPHAGRICQVYSQWQGKTVRLKLGEEAASKYQDIFSVLQVRRVYPHTPRGLGKRGNSLRVPAALLGGKTKPIQSLLKIGRPRSAGIYFLP